MKGTLCDYYLHSLFVMFGKFLDNVSKFKDCNVELKIQDDFNNNEKVIGPFPVSNIITFSPDKAVKKYDSFNLIDLIVNLRRNEEIIGSASIGINASGKNAYYSRVITLGGESFQVVYYFACAPANRYEKLKIFTNHLKWKHYELSCPYDPVYLSLGIQFNDNGQTLAYHEYDASFQNNDEGWMRQLNIFSLIDHPNILKLSGYNCSKENKIGFFVVQPENDVIRSYFPGLSFINCMAGIFSGMSYLNSCGFFHGNLEPESIFIDSNHYTKIVDFRRSRSMAEEIPDNILKIRSKNTEFVKITLIIDMILTQLVLLLATYAK